MRSDHIGHLTEQGRYEMKAYGISTVIDLRSPSELRGDPGKRPRVKGVKYVHRPLVDDSNMRKLGEASNMFERYLMMLNNRPQAFRGIFNAVAEADEEGGVLFHCYAGKDRTGLVAAMLLSLASVPAEHIAVDFAETDEQLAKKYAQWISEAPPEKRDEMRSELQCPPDRILGVLDYLDRTWGGVGGYLEASGMKPANIDVVSAKLI